MRLARPFLALILILSIVGVLCSFRLPTDAAAQSSPTLASTSTSKVMDILVRFTNDVGSSPTTSRLVADALQKAGVSHIYGFLGSNSTFRLGIAPGRDAASVAALLSRDPSVLYAEPNQIFGLNENHAYSLPAATSTQDHWGLDRVHAPRAWPLAESSSVTVAVLDTGVSSNHPGLAGRVLPGWNFVSDDGNSDDDNGHGTFVAGIIAGSTRPDGASGVAPNVKILPVKILDRDSAGSTVNFVAGINYAVSSGAQVINISAGGIVPSRALADTVADAESRGVLIVSSAGNGTADEPIYPAALSTVLAVGATDQGDATAPFSSTGAYVDLAAPGVDIVSTWWSHDAGNGYAVASGTSAAAPFVTGAAALLLGLNPQLTPARVRQLLTETALDIGPPGIDASSGFGLLDAYMPVLLTQTAASGAATVATLSREESAESDRINLSAAGLVPGETVSLWASSAGGVVVFRGHAADEFGVVSVDLGPLSRFSDGVLTANVVGDISRASAAGHLMIASAATLAAFAPTPAFASTSDRLYVPETGHSLSYGFKQFWETHGGLAVFGYPISEEFSELNPDTGGTYTVQYFERNRFEYHPENAGTAWEVSLGRLGAQIAAQAYPSTPGAGGLDDALYFPETGHTLSGPFRAYWEAHGGLQLFGYPISEPFESGGQLVQYFERNRFELHPDLPAEHQVLLARFGVDLARQQRYLR